MKYTILTGLGFALMGAALLGNSWTVTQKMSQMEQRISVLEATVNSSATKDQASKRNKSTQRQSTSPLVSKESVQRTEPSVVDKKEDAEQPASSLAGEDRRQIREERLMPIVESLSEDLDWTDAVENEVLDTLLEVTEQRAEIRRDARNGTMARGEIRSRMMEVRTAFREDLISIVGQEDAELVFERLPSGRGR